MPFPATKISPPLLSVAAWRGCLATPGMTWWPPAQQCGPSRAVLPSPGAAGRCGERLGSGRNPGALCVHDREIILHSFPCVFPWFTTYSAGSCWNILIAFVCSNSKGSYKYFQIKAVPVPRALVQPCIPSYTRHRRYRTRRLSCFFKIILWRSYQRVCRATGGGCVALTPRSITTQNLGSCARRARGAGWESAWVPGASQHVFGKV